MRFIVFALTLLIITGCTMAQLAPASDRRVEIIQKTKATKTEAYNKALVYFGKRLGDSNHASKVADKEQGQIVIKANMPCNVFRQSLDPKEYFLAFDLDFQAKDNRVRLVFEDMRILDDHGQLFIFDYNQLVSAEQTQKAKSCLADVARGLASEINKTTEEW